MHKREQPLVYTRYTIISFIFTPAEERPISRLPAQAQNAVPGKFVFLTYQTYDNSNALFVIYDYY